MPEIGQANEALETKKAALEIYRELGYRRGEGAALNNLGNSYMGRRRLARIQSDRHPVMPVLGQETAQRARMLAGGVLQDQDLHRRIASTHSVDSDREQNPEPRPLATGFRWTHTHCRCWHLRPPRIASHYGGKKFFGSLLVAPLMKEQGRDSRSPGGGG
jgi:hypothetical protein